MLGVPAFWPAEQGVDLPLVGPAEHVVAAVVDAVRSSFSCRPPLPLTCPALVIALGLAAELGHRLDALVGRPAGPARAPATRRTACP